MMKLHAAVRLREDLPEHGLRRGALGAIVAIFGNPSHAYEVEFSDAQGRTLAEVALHEEQLEEVPS
jgi:hypothetical protein